MAQNEFSGSNLALGDRVDVAIGEMTGISSVQDITGNDRFVISAPVDKSVTLRIPEKTPVSIVYYKQSGIFSFTAVKRKEFKQNAVQMVEMQIKSPISKFQRRDFVRHEKMLPIRIRVLARPEDVEQSNIETVLMSSIYEFKNEDVQVESDVEEVITGLTADISGGGLRFSSNNFFSPQTLIEFVVSLDQDDEFVADGTVVRCDDRNINGFKDFMTSVKFVNVTESDRRKIIKFIFDDQVKARRKKSR